MASLKVSQVLCHEKNDIIHSEGDQGQDSASFQPHERQSIKPTFLVPGCVRHFTNTRIQRDGSRDIFIACRERRNAVSLLGGTPVVASLC